MIIITIIILIPREQTCVSTKDWFDHLPCIYNIICYYKMCNYILVAVHFFQVIFIFLLFQLHWHSLPYQKTKQKQIITWDKKLTKTYIPAIISPDLAMTLKLLATRSIESPWVNNTSCSGCKPLFVKKEIINTLFVLYNYADEMKIGHFSKNSLLVIQLYYRKNSCISRTRV